MQLHVQPQRRPGQLCCPPLAHVGVARTPEYWGLRMSALKGFCRADGSFTKVGVQGVLALRRGYVFTENPASSTGGCRSGSYGAAVAQEDVLLQVARSPSDLRIQFCGSLPTLRVSTCRRQPAYKVAMAPRHVRSNHIVSYCMRTETVTLKNQKANAEAHTHSWPSR